MDPKTKQKTLRLLTNGMYILTARGGEEFGASTITWASQASFKPPLIMAAVRRNSGVLGCMKQSGEAALHILDRSQKAIAQKFFSATKHAHGKLNGEPYIEGQTSAPILQNVRAHVECKVVDIREEYGDHALVVLEVIDAQLGAHIHPLIVAESPWQYGG